MAEYQFTSSYQLLGLAESGFFPGVIVYLTHWFYTTSRTAGHRLVLRRHASRDRPAEIPTSC